MPCFDVEMTPDGKYLLIPKDCSNKNLFKDGQDTGNKVSPASGWGKLFNQNLSYGYAALMEVLRFLSVKERATAVASLASWVSHANLLATENPSPPHKDSTASRKRNAAARQLPAPAESGNPACPPPPQPARGLPGRGMGPSSTLTPLSSGPR